MTRDDEPEDATGARDEPGGDAEALLLQCLAAGEGLPSARDALRASESAEAARAARLLAMLDEFGFLHEPDAVTPGLPERIGAYRIQALLGSGGMGTVYLAEHAQLGRRVALKVLHRELAATGKAQARFHREALVASRLDHSGICTVYDVGRDGGQAFLAMRHVPGRDLAAHLAVARRQQRGMLVLPGAAPGVMPIVQFVAKAADALHAAHEAGLVHRDVKPGNLMVTPAGEPVLLDFGLALAVGTEAEGEALTLSGDRIGTPVYMAPEQVAGQRADRRADVYALGVVLYECLAGEPPFREVNRESLFRAILQGDVPDARRANRAIGRELWVVLQTALAREPERRYATTAALADDLRRVATNRPILARRPGVVLRLRRFAQRNPVVAALFAGLVVVTVVLGWMWSERGDALAQLEVALRNASAVEMALRASDGRAGPVPSLQQALSGYEQAPNPDTFSALCAATLRCREQSRMELDTFPSGVLPSMVQISPAGREILTIGFDGVARMWDLQGRLLWAFVHLQMVNTAVFSPLDGRQVLTASMDGTAKVWQRDGERWKLLFTLPHGKPVQRPETDWIDPTNTQCVLWADWSPDGRCLATGCSDRSVKFWDPATGQPLGEPLRQHRGPPIRHAWSRDSRCLASAESDARFTIDLAPAHVLVYGTGAAHELLATLPHPRAVYSVEFTADGRQIVTSCGDGNVRVWSVAERRELATIPLGGYAVNAQLSSDGKRILACSTNGTVGVFSLDGKTLERRTFDTGTWAQFAVGDRILAHGPAHSVMLLDSRLREQLTFRGHSLLCGALAMTSDGRHVVSTSQDMTVRVWNVLDPDLPRLLGHEARAVGLALLPDGAVASIAGDGDVRIWSSDGTERDRLTIDMGEREQVDRVCPIDRAGRRLAVPGTDAIVRVLDLETRQVRQFKAHGPGGRGCSAAWLPDGRLVVGGAGRPDIAVYALDGSPMVPWSKVTNGVVKAVAVAPRRGLVFAVGWNGKIAVWKHDGTFVREVETGHSSWFETMVLSGDESLLAAGGGDHLVRLWRVGADGQLAPLPHLGGHDALVTSLAWSPDGRLLASGSSDGAVRLWNAATWQPIVAWRGHDRAGVTNKVNSVLFSADGQHLFTAGDDGSVQSWPTDPTMWIEIARRKVGRVLGGSLDALMAGQDHAEITALAGRLVDEAICAGDWRRLNGLAWWLVDPARHRKPPALDIAERAIRASLEIWPQPYAGRLKTRARLLFWRGDHAGALAEQEKAVALEDRPDLRASLEEYERLVEPRR